MNKNLLHKEVQDFIHEHLNTPVHTILLGKKKFSAVDNSEIVAQIESKRKSKDKLPTWFSTQNIYYANKLNISQTSSEVTAKYKADLVSGETLIDLTGGFGVDTYFFSKKFNTVFHVEKNIELSRISNHNFKQLRSDTITCVNHDGIQYLKSFRGKVDWIYLDPSRRDENNKRVYYLQDCEPNVIDHLELLFSKSDSILIKTGPLLDISKGLNQLKFVSEIHIVAVRNEVKEILWILKKEGTTNLMVKTININKDKIDRFNFNFRESNESQAEYSEPIKYLYEPNASIMKSGAFDLIGSRYGVKKLQENSHLYTSLNLKPFPGRIFNIEKVLPYKKKNLKALGLKQANITTRNFPDSVQAIRKKTGLKDGGSDFLFFTKNLHGKPIVIFTSKINQD